MTSFNWYVRVAVVAGSRENSKNDNRENQEMKKKGNDEKSTKWTRRRKSQKPSRERFWCVFLCVFEDVERCVRVDLLSSSAPSRP